jgi:hypothetical protein
MFAGIPGLTTSPLCIAKIEQTTSPLQPPMRKKDTTFVSQSETIGCRALISTSTVSKGDGGGYVRMKITALRGVQTLAAKGGDSKT